MSTPMYGRKRRVVMAPSSHGQVVMAPSSYGQEVMAHVEHVDADVRQEARHAHALGSDVDRRYDGVVVPDRDLKKMFFLDPPETFRASDGSGVDKAVLVRPVSTRDFSPVALLRPSRNGPK